MLSDWQNIAAPAVVVAAIAYLAYRFRRTLLRGGKGMCGVCVRSCGKRRNRGNDGVIPVETLARPLKRS